MVANAAQLKGKQRENVENFGAQGILSKELATIKIDVPVDFDEEDLRYAGVDDEKLRAIFSELEFRTLAARVFKEGPVKKSTASSSGPAQMDLFGAPASQPTNQLEEGEDGEVI